MSEARVAAKLRARQEGRSVGQRVSTEDGMARSDDYQYQRRNRHEGGTERDREATRARGTGSVCLDLDPCQLCMSTRSGGTYEQAMVARNSKKNCLFQFTRDPLLLYVNRGGITGRISG